ncbi:recombinase family protein [Vibrio harveyi]|nr:recombinase family protein [Vibrio harveyi]
MPITTKTAILYSRVSSLRQKDGLGLDRQYLLQVDACKEKGWIVSDENTYQDIASGFHAKHMDGALGIILEAVDAGKINKQHVIVVESLDRLGREEPLEALERFVQIMKKTDIYEVSTGMMYSADEQGFGVMVAIACFIFERANNESLMKQKRSLSNWNQKVEEAKATKGFKAITGRTPTWIDVEDGYYVLNDNAKYVVEIFDMYTKGNGTSKIVQYLKDIKAPVFFYKLNAKNTKTRAWNIGRVDNILRSAATYGAMTNSKTGEVTEKRYPAAISKETFQKARAIKRQKATNGSKQATVLNILSGITSCDCCGHSYSHLNAASKKLPDGTRAKRRVLRCRHRASKGDCTNRQVPYHRILGYTLRYARDFEYKSKLDTGKLRLDIQGLEQEKTNLQNLLLIDAGNKAFVSKFASVVKDLQQLQQELDAAIALKPDTSVFGRMLKENTTDEVKLLVQRQLQLILKDIKINALNKTMTLHYVDNRDPVTVNLKNGELV